MTMAKQLEVPGAEREQDPDLRNLGEKLLEVKEERAEHRSRTQKLEDEARERLIAEMKKKNRTTFNDGYVEVTLTTTTTDKLDIKRVPQSERPENDDHLDEAKANRRSRVRVVQDQGAPVEP